jgi:hypothetical protein
MHWVNPLSGHAPKVAVIVYEMFNAGNTAFPWFRPVIERG